MSSVTTLRLLASIITDALHSVELVYQKAGLSFPSLDDPFDPGNQAEALRQDKTVAAAVNNIVAAAAQISATVSDPMRMAVHISSCLNAASELNVVEILREAGPKVGLLLVFIAKDIAAPSQTDAGLLERVLRLLATHHIFREVSPGVFANNRIQSPLNKLPFNLACKTNQGMFSWMQDPENRSHVLRFAVAMQGTGATEPPETIFQGFDWSLLPSNDLIVDVGGGIGHSSLTIAKRYPHLRIINQDLGPTLEVSKGHWKEHFPEHLESQMAQFQVQDFFTPQSVKDAAIFILRYILHDWPDKTVGTILGHLRDAALPTTRLVVIEKIQPFASVEEVSGSKANQIPGAARPTAPPPLLPNWGAATADLYFYDMTMHVMLGGVERTLDAFYNIFLEAGWKLIEVHHCSGSQLSHLVALPV
ncbi:O-methyltransferase [Mycena crocata]|nr:O-methyltransferase [Mycena crocata]